MLCNGGIGWQRTAAFIIHYGVKNIASRLACYILLCILNLIYDFTFGSSRPNFFFLSTILRIKPIISAATPRLASITSGAV